MSKLNEHFDKFNSRGFRIEERLKKDPINENQLALDVVRSLDKVSKMVKHVIFSDKDTLPHKEIENIHTWTLKNPTAAKELVKKCEEIIKLTIGMMAHKIRV